ncbi:PAS domain-containing sensor histidine kinase [Rhodohalobacter mucosus]|uniref:histidine kinase n=1 Tax=Rhodohalobacter mucosus TaxID=2079485 RepID=A0A316TZN5_9BACT|nr:PAS domain S-box protein [Rhodohalobacter mucosus]PWN05676.1 hypothetical protein DDZ15_13890 [Rhodohalobacter mucosus]
MLDVKPDKNRSVSDVQLINAMPGAAAVLDSHGHVVLSNKKWNDHSGSAYWFGETVGGGNYFEKCRQRIEDGNDYALKVLFGLRSVIDGEKDHFELSIPAGDYMDSIWYKLFITSTGNAGQALIFFEDISKSMESLRNFRESSEVYSQQFNNSLAGIILGTPEGRIIDVNPAACKMLGYSREELLDGGRSLIVDVNSPLNKEMYKEREEKSSYEGEKEYIHKNGSIVTVEVCSLLFRNKNGDLRTMNTFRDKSMEKESIQNLKDERRFTKAAINSIPNAFFVIDDDYRLVQWNNPFFDELGYDNDCLEGISVFEIIPRHERNRVSAVLAEAFETGTGHVITEVISKKADGQHYHFFGNTFESKGKKYLVGTGTDITDLIETEKEKDKNYELLSQLFETSPLGMVMLKPDMRVAKVNESFANLFGYSKLEIIGENLDELIVHKEEREANRVFNTAVFAGTVMKKEAIRYTKEKKALNTIINTVPIYEAGSVVGAFGIYVDVTEQKELESRIQKSLKEKDILLQEVHHRVKNNLAIISGLLDLQIMEEENSQMQYKLNEVRSRIFSIAKIHESLYEKEDVVQIRFDEYLESVLSALPQKSIQNGTEVTFKTDIGPVMLNLNQAVPFGMAVNELMNVIFMDRSGIDKISVALREEKGKVHLSIKGKGIQTEELRPEDTDDTFHKTLIRIFLSQINGIMDVSAEDETRISVSFSKMNVRGSSSSVLSANELIG